MTHLIVCREYPPAPYPPGGIGTYVKHMAHLLAEAGEMVHVVAQRWQGAVARLSESCGGKLAVHRIALDEPVERKSGMTGDEVRTLQGLAASDCPSQAFSWQATQFVEALIESQPIDVIEGPEWEAPLYYLQMRRALGLGPKAQPPCLIHLHSPSRLIFRHNQWDQTLTDYEPLVGFEDYTVRAADGLVCPSRYLAREAERQFNLAPDSIPVIPYPLGDTPVLERRPEVWSRNTICYVGRLELRKGVVEWVDAAACVARSHPSVNFEFFGSDTSLHGGAGGSVREYLDSRIPRALRQRFRFHGPQSHNQLLKSLGTVSAAVVPSRWDNLPYSCMEAMGTGLPVLISPTGGMAELVRDGQSGWVASDGSVAGLESVLRRVLETPAVKRAAMGREAARAVRSICGNERILERHMELRAGLAAAGAGRSRRVPTGVRGTMQPAPDRRGFGIVVTCLEHAERLAGCLDSIRRQTQAAEGVVLVIGPAQRFAAEQARPEGWTMVCTEEAAPERARRMGAEALLESAPHLLGIAFLDQNARVEPSYVQTCASVLEQRPEVGAVSSWVRYEGQRIEYDARPTSLMPAAANDSAIGYASVRVAAFLAGGGWTTITWPDVLVSVDRPQSDSVGVKERRYSVMALAQRGSANLALSWFLAAPLKEKVRWVRRGLAEPRRTARSLAWLARSAAGRAFASR